MFYLAGHKPVDGIAAKLVGHRHAVAALNQPRHVTVYRVVGHARHRHAGVFAHWPRGERYV
jgi:hypothetical protein